MVTLDEIQQAAELVKKHLNVTSIHPSGLLSKLTGADVYLKLENRQLTASFKARGALIEMLSLNEQQKKQGVVAMSAGNHAQAVAYHAQQLNIPATIVMPRYTPNIKVQATEQYGAKVILEGRIVDEAGEFARQLSEQHGYYLVHPFDNENVIRGQGTIALEMLEKVPELETIIVPIGGGGLISGIATAAKLAKPSIEIIGVQTAQFPTMHQVMNNQPIKCGFSTIAEGIAVKKPGMITREYVQKYVDDILLVEDQEIERAVLLLLEKEKLVAEGAGAAPLSALLNFPDRFSGKKVGLVISGGNIDILILSSIIQRGLARSERLVQISIDGRDAPGGLNEITQILAELEVNIIDVSHQRAFTDLSLQNVAIEFVLQTRGPEHAKFVVDSMRKRGYSVEVIRQKPAMGLNQLS